MPQSWKYVPLKWPNWKYKSFNNVISFVLSSQGNNFKILSIESKSRRAYVPHDQLALHNPFQLSCITKSLVDELQGRYLLAGCRFFCFLENHKTILYVPLRVLLHSERESKKCIPKAQEKNSIHAAIMLTSSIYFRSSWSEVYSSIWRASLIER